MPLNVPLCMYLAGCLPVDPRRSMPLVPSVTTVKYLTFAHRLQPSTTVDTGITSIRGATTSTTMMRSCTGRSVDRVTRTTARTPSARRRRRRSRPPPDAPSTSSDRRATYTGRGATPATSTARGCARRLATPTPCLTGSFSTKYILLLSYA